ncbi:expressed unknown protein [Seminavis robusta]|uniref:Secreted protein n=1 Tax=Seminavis robusta TaxID=568900 RepID=A0A9N8EXQ3_9STRA|nr:expressed unknown protein [Seminavis robusta]|eukprot:Sro2734_g335840.1 n/a (100) ;mRNA; r:2376-2675
MMTKILTVLVVLLLASVNAGSFARRGAVDSNKKEAVHVSILPPVPAFVNTARTTTPRAPTRRGAKQTTQKIESYSLEASLCAPEVLRGGAQEESRGRRQ